MHNSTPAYDLPICPVHKNEPSRWFEVLNKYKNHVITHVGCLQPGCHQFVTVVVVELGQKVPYFEVDARWREFVKSHGRRPANVKGVDLSLSTQTTLSLEAEIDLLQRALKLITDECVQYKAKYASVSMSELVLKRKLDELRSDWVSTRVMSSRSVPMGSLVIKPLGLLESNYGHPPTDEVVTVLLTPEENARSAQLMSLRAAESVARDGSREQRSGC